MHVGHSLLSLGFAVCCLLTILFISSIGKVKPRDREWVSLITQWVSNRVILNQCSSPVPVLGWHSICNPETADRGQALFNSHVEGARGSNYSPVLLSSQFTFYAATKITFLKHKDDHFVPLFESIQRSRAELLKYQHAHKSSRDLTEIEILIWQAGDSAFLTSSQMVLMLLVLTPHVEEQE